MQFSLRLMCIITIFFAVCFSLTKNIIYPYCLQPLYKTNPISYYYYYSLLVVGMISIYFLLMHGRENIIENPRGWFRKGGHINLALASILFYLLISVYLILQIVFLICL